MLGPALMVYGTDEQRARWMPRILNADDIWCQLFSEPGAGSDLAGLSTRAERHGDVYVVTGQKVWSTGAQFTDWGLALVRTDPDAPKRKGISMLGIPMTAEGVDVRPLRQMTGDSEFNEVFLDEVEVPAENVIGPENEGGGWRTTSSPTSAAAASSGVSRCAWRKGSTGCGRRARVPVCSTIPSSASGWRRAWIDAEIFRLHNARTLSRLARGEEIGAESSLVKLFWSEASKRLYETAYDLLADPEWVNDFLYSRANTIMGGTSEIQRNIIGERLLGLPR
jgi:Acyl-CoA dehydrogenases